MNKKINKELIISILIPVILGFIVAIITNGDIKDFNNLNLPKIVPPGYVFGIVWTILYTLMGISSYLIYDSNDYHRNCCLLVYGLNLFVNLLWSIIFFSLKLRLFAFIWLIFLIIIVIYMISCFYNINKKAAYLNIPYAIWLLFAAVLNFLVYIMNR